MSATLHLLPQPRPEVAHPLLTLTQGHPVLVADADVDLIDFVNAGTQVLEPTTDPDTISPATMQVAWFVHHVGDTHRTGGDRSVNLASHLARWILPFLIELSHTKPVGQRTVTDLWFAEAERLAKVLAGAERLPAATVVGDLLGWRGVACVWLTILEAGQVCHGGAQAITDAISRRQFITHRDGAGHVLVRTADLRTAGLLIEKDVPTGVDRTYAKNILYPFKQAMLRAANLGAHLRGNFETVRAIEPLARDRARAPRVDPGYISLTTIAALGPHLTVVFQIVLWLLRLMGLRIGEAYGLLVSGLFFDEETGAWVLAVEKQGGRKATVRNPDAGELERRDSKPGTKTTQSHRLVRRALELRSDVSVTRTRVQEIQGEVSEVLSRRTARADPFTRTPRLPASAISTVHRNRTAGPQRRRPLSTGPTWSPNQASITTTPARKDRVGCPTTASRGPPRLPTRTHRRRPQPPTRRPLQPSVPPSRPGSHRAERGADPGHPPVERPAGSWVQILKRCHRARHCQPRIERYEMGVPRRGPRSRKPSSSEGTGEDDGRPLEQAWVFRRYPVERRRDVGGTEWRCRCDERQPDVGGVQPGQGSIWTQDAGVPQRSVAVHAWGHAAVGTQREVPVHRSQ